MTCATVNYINRRAEAIGGGNEAKLLVASVEIELLEMQRDSLLKSLDMALKMVERVSGPIQRIDPVFCRLLKQYMDDGAALILEAHRQKARVGA